MSSRADRMARVMAYGTRACDRDDAMLGTFIPDNRSEPHTFGSLEFIPEVAEEEERVVCNDCLRTRSFSKGTLHWRLNEPFVPLDEIVDPRTDFQVQVSESDNEE